MTDATDTRACRVLLFNVRMSMTDGEYCAWVLGRWDL